MSEPILDPGYWKARLESATRADAIHHAIFRCPLAHWEAIEAKHRLILANAIGLHESVLDVGCGYGRLLRLLPKCWRGDYAGLDLSPDFIRLAQLFHPDRKFLVARADEAHEALDDCGFNRFDWAVLISFRPMVKRNLGDDAWAAAERSVRQCAKKLLFLEYDPNDEGSIE